jgi:hypothetical protein
MTNASKRISTSLFGYDKNQVKEYIEELHIVHDKRIEEVRNRVNLVKSENEKLAQEMEKLTEELHTQLKPDEFMEFALGRFHEWKDLVGETARDEAQEINIIMENQRKAFEKKIQEVDDDINVMQNQLDILLKNVLIKNENLSENVKMFIGDKLYSEYNTCSAYNQNKEVANLNSDNSVDDTTYEKEISTEKIKSNISEVIEGEAIIEPRGFWGDEIEELSEDSAGYSNFESNNSVNDNKINMDNRPVAQDILPEEDKVVKDKEQVESMKRSESKAIASEINQIRSKYLVGKIAGEDLYDRNNKIIIYKNSVITSEVIEMAEREGKLADLIVNMYLPEMTI